MGQGSPRAAHQRPASGVTVMTENPTSPPFRTDNYEVREWEERRQWYVANRETDHRVGDFFSSQGAAERWMVRCQEDYDAGRIIGERRRSLLTTQEAADMLDIHRSRILHLIKDGRLTATKVGRDWVIKPSDLDPIRERKTGWPKGRPRKEG